MGGGSANVRSYSGVLMLFGLGLYPVRWTPGIQLLIGTRLTNYALATLCECEIGFRFEMCSQASSKMQMGMCVLMHFQKFEDAGYL